LLFLYQELLNFASSQLSCAPLPPGLQGPLQVIKELPKVCCAFICLQF
jgi:hypothetical protein